MFYWVLNKPVPLIKSYSYNINIVIWLQLDCIFVYRTITRQGKTKNTQGWSNTGGVDNPPSTSCSRVKIFFDVKLENTKFLLVNDIETLFID